MCGECLAELVITLLKCVAGKSSGEGCVCVCVGRGELSPAVPAVWGTSDVSTEKDMGSAVKIMACPADNDDSCGNQGVVADV